MGGGGPTPFLPMEKCVFSHFSPWGKMGKKAYGKKGKSIHFPLFPYTFFHGQKWGWTPPPINTNKACGPDEIPGIVLKMCSISLALPLSIIYNLVYNTGSLPLQWKLSNIFPIFNEGDSKIVSNYRPVSLLCIASKIMERIIHEEMLIKVGSVIDKRQHGFSPNRSCATNLTILIEDITKSLHNNVGTDIIYFDFAKAFDSVSHDIILNKLKTKFSIDGRLLKFLQDYLKHRKQRVII